MHRSIHFAPSCLLVMPFGQLPSVTGARQIERASMTRLRSVRAGPDHIHQDLKLPRFAGRGKCGHQMAWSGQILNLQAMNTETPQRTPEWPRLRS
jgi:hypothetical protein